MSVAKKPRIVGCFELTALEKGKWEVKNTITNFVHCTYGTLKEIVQLLKAQTPLWEEKAAGLKVGINARNAASVADAKNKAQRKMMRRVF